MCMETRNKYELYNGRPRECLIEDIEKKVYDFLDAVEIEYQTLKHPIAYTMEECEKIREYIHAPVFKNLFLTNKQHTKFYLLVMPAYKIFKTKYLSSQINSARLSFADDETLNNLLGVKPGSVTPMGLINDSSLKVEFLIDTDLKTEDIFACHPCLNNASIIMKLSDLTDKFIPATKHGVKWVTLPNE